MPEKQPITDSASPPMRPRRRWKRWVLAALLSPLIAVALINTWVLVATDSRMFEVDGAVPEMPVAVVLGTSKSLVNGRPNLHFERRMDAAAALYRAGRVKILLVSGAKNGPYYNEPRDMTEALKTRGVPPEAVVGDPAGFRTLDSIVRARDVFGLDRFLIISDDWHVPRALFIARKYGINAIGVGAKDIDWGNSFKSRSREWFARVLVVLDLYFMDTKPRQPHAEGEPVLGIKTE